MRCSNCGEPIEEGRLFCLNCGQEVQWVPDYDSFGDYMVQEKLKKKKNRQKPPLPESVQRSQLRTAVEKSEEETDDPGICRRCSCSGCCRSVFQTWYGQKNYNDFDYQIRMADTAFSNHKYEESYKFVERAVSLNDSDVDAKLLLAQVQVKLEKTDQAIKTLQNVIRLEPDNQSAYNQLIKIYMENDQPDEVKNLLDSCDNDDILNKFSAYISKNPVFSLPEGSYDEPKTLSLYSKEDEDQIYYTTDGTDPTSSSNLYTDSIALKEGQTIIKAVTVNKKGITSDIVSKTYTIAYEAPDPPQISPSSGSFTTDMDTNIYIIVPEGCRAYYAFDKKPTIADELYQEDQPVKMLKGTHTFYAILVDEHNKVSSPGSAIYKLTEAK